MERLRQRGRSLIASPCERALRWVLGLHLLLLLGLWALMQAAWQVPVAGVLAVAVALVIALRARPPLALIAPRFGLVAGAAAVMALTGAAHPAHVPYAAVLAFLAAYLPGGARAALTAPDDPEDELLARLDELDRTKDQLLAVVSHEFRTPLTGMLGFARTLSAHLGDLDEDTLRVFVDSIQGQSKRLARLVDNLVTAARPPEPEPDASCDLHAVVAGVMAELDIAPDDDHRVLVSLRGKLIAAIGEDAARRILFNLLDNAVKFADPDTIVRLDARPQGGDLVIDVTNVGPPIPADLRERLYEPFVQGDSSDSRKAEGLGLGLHVARQLAEAHGGRVDLLDGNGLVVFRVRLLPATEAAWERPAVAASTS